METPFGTELHICISFGLKRWGAGMSKGGLTFFESAHILAPISHHLPHLATPCAPFGPRWCQKEPQPSNGSRPSACTRRRGGGATSRSASMTKPASRIRPATARGPYLATPSSIDARSAQGMDSPIRGPLDEGTRSSIPKGFGVNQFQR
jgi:hypothetical protein